ncbi:hypothetical protein E5676_scaffold169G002380 [Cucumis melo var. makuwa]|uniref:Uncharacterized protein n=1 Tax=Cucumis melo var. makuwa TaxID=1194695 RepID=A0A5D3BNE4_CUCMM|nr:hypothetical protein E6C27_scaffold64G002360 [Cucumis melo var. makuwa]TYK00618.1 hypothetical protein E5676_scaffold169G002380 [Cucumis melo var. makuwa]
MGGRSSFCGLTMVVVVVMSITILSSSYSCRGSVLMKANATYGGVSTTEMIIYHDITRFLMPPGSKPVTGNTGEPNIVPCNNGPGNQFGQCGGNANNQQQCNRYDTTKPC